MKPNTGLSKLNFELPLWGSIRRLSSRRMTLVAAMIQQLNVRKSADLNRKPRQRDCSLSKEVSFFRKCIRLVVIAVTDDASTRKWSETKEGRKQQFWDSEINWQTQTQGHGICRNIDILTRPYSTGLIKDSSKINFRLTIVATGWAFLQVTRFQNLKYVTK